MGQYIYKFDRNISTQVMVLKSLQCAHGWIGRLMEGNSSIPNFFSKGIGTNKRHFTLINVHKMISSSVDN